MKLNILVVLGMLATLVIMACSGAPQADSTDAANLVNGMADSLRSAGADVQNGGEVNQPFISVPGQILQVNSQDVQVFEYLSVGDADQAAAQVSSDGSAVGTTMIGWVLPPHFFQDGRLIVLYVGEGADVLQLLAEVLGPQFAGR
jgi:hypothetical protein